MPVKTRPEYRPWFFLAAALFLIGCMGQERLRHTPAECRISHAKDCVDFLSSFPEGEIDGEKLAEAVESLAEASDAMGKNEPERAGESAGKSDLICVKLLKELYEKKVTSFYADLEKRLSEMERNDPESPAAKYLAEARPAGKDEVFGNKDSIEGIQGVLDGLNTVLSATAIIRSNFQTTLATDSGFRKKSVELSETGKKSLDLFVDTVWETEIPYRKSLSMIRMKVVGYTDSLNFGKDSPLLEAVKAKIEGKIPQNEPERRKFLNRKLSELRSEAVAEYIYERLDRLRKEKNRKIDLKIEKAGRGEDLPFDLPPPYPVPDHRRRICRIYLFFQ